MSRRTRPSRVKLRSLVRDYVLDYMEDNPEADEADVIPAVKDQIQDDLKGSPFLGFLLALVEILAPLLIPLILKKPER